MFYILSSSVIRTSVSCRLKSILEGDDCDKKAKKFSVVFSKSLSLTMETLVHCRRGELRVKRKEDGKELPKSIAAANNK